MMATVHNGCQINTCKYTLTNSNMEHFEDLRLLGYLPQPYAVWHEDVDFIATLCRC
jgi:hypothetical protein